MRKITESQVELIDAVIAEKATGGLTPAILEKDIHVTEALHTLFSIQYPHIDLIFCGGTSLSKAHGIIERMSEDIDLKVKLSSEHRMSRSAEKNHLRNFKHQLIEQMIKAGFEQTHTGPEAHNENKYVATTWQYESCYSGDVSLRPHLRLEYTVRTPAFPVSSVLIGSLVDQLAEQEGTKLPITCIAIEETLAEKVLSFLRRYAQHRSGAGQQPWDTALVRHIYDVFCIVQAVPHSVEKAKNHFADLVKFDTNEFSLHTTFTKNPKACMFTALEAVETDAQTRTEYQTRLMPLIYGKTQPGFADAFQVFKTSSNALLATL